MDAQQNFFSSKFGFFIQESCLRNSRKSLEFQMVRTSKEGRIYANPVRPAYEWQRALVEGNLSKAKLSRRLGVSRARVTQVLNLLKLPPEVLKDISDLGHPLPSSVITERMLRFIVKLPMSEQESRINEIMSSAQKLFERN